MLCKLKQRRRSRFSWLWKVDPQQLLLPLCSCSMYGQGGVCLRLRQGHWRNNWCTYACLRVRVCVCVCVCVSQQAVDVQTHEDAVRGKVAVAVGEVGRWE